MKVGDRVRYGDWIKNVGSVPKPIGVIMGFDETVHWDTRVDVLWPSGNRKLLPISLFEVVQ